MEHASARNSFLDEYIQRLFSKDAAEEPVDVQSVGESDMKLPDWYDDKKFKRGQQFFWRNCFGVSMSLVVGLISVLSVPSILNILVKSRRSSSPLTAYRRYHSTLQHNIYWFTYDLKPDTLSWKSLCTIRNRHFRAGNMAKLNNSGIVSQRDVALTLQGFFGFLFLNPDVFSVTQEEESGWEGYNHFWGVIAHMLGLKDEFNMCRYSFIETKQLCRIIQDRVFTPCLHNPPEYFEHMSRVMLDGISVIFPSLEKTSALYLTKRLANIPGYVWTELERKTLLDKINKEKESANKNGVASASLIEQPAIEGLPIYKTQILYSTDYISVDTAPAYKQLPFIGRYKLSYYNITFWLYSTYVGHRILNFYFKIILFTADYLPFVCIWRYGIKHTFINPFNESVSDLTILQYNSEYYKPRDTEKWYEKCFSLLW